MRILMVCLGNICRSPLAEGILQTKVWKAGLNWDIDSAGTNGYHIGEPPHHLSQKIAEINKVSIGYQRSRLFLKTEIKNFDIIYAMAEDVYWDILKIAGDEFNPNKVKLITNELPQLNIKDIPDPYYGKFEGYIKVYDLLDNLTDKIISKYSN